MSADICPGVRRLVAALNKAGWPTCDSGDGSHHAAGMEGARPYPHVTIQLPTHRVAHLLDEAHAVRVWLDAGLATTFSRTAPQGLGLPCIQATFDPAQPNVGLIDIMHVSDDMIDWDSPEPEAPR